MTTPARVMTTLASLVRVCVSGVSTADCQRPRVITCAERAGRLKLSMLEWLYRAEEQWVGRSAQRSGLGEVGQGRMVMLSQRVRMHVFRVVGLRGARRWLPKSLRWQWFSGSCLD